MSENEKLKENIRATMQFEGFYMNDKDFNIIDKFLNNEISIDEGINKIKNEFQNNI